MTITLTREEAQQVLDALKHLCLHTAAIKGYDAHKVQPPIDMLKAKLKQPENEFNPDWNAMAAMVEEQQRMAKRIEELTQLVTSQGIRLMDAEARAECDGGQCGIGGYCKQCPKVQQSWCMAMNKCENKCEDCPDKPKPEPVVKLKELLEVQGRDGTWNYDPYFHGMYNGMEVMFAVLENREPVFRGAPEKWLSKKGWVGLTNEEVKILATQGRTDFSRPSYNEFYSAIAQALKEKNT